MKKGCLIQHVWVESVTPNSDQPTTGKAQIKILPHYRTKKPTGRNYFALSVNLSNLISPENFVPGPYRLIDGGILPPLVRC